MSKIKRALLSVTNKTGIVDFARALVKLDIEILSTGGTAKLLAHNGIAVTEVSQYTGFPEMMDGRLKTLHPKIHGGLLGRRGIDDEAMSNAGIAPIDLVVVNLYPFEETIANADCTLQLAVENIDIGGPTMIRAAAKNYDAVTIIVDNNDFSVVLEEMQNNNALLSKTTRFSLAVKAFEHTAKYDGSIANYLGKINSDGAKDIFPRSFNIQMKKIQDLRYGENPHQQAAFYGEYNFNEASVATARQLQGKELSFNNIADTDAALECVKSFPDTHACVIVKHANPCGVALGNNQLDAYKRAYATDPTSAFGGIIAFNRPLESDTAAAIIDRQFVEVIIAPAVTDNAMQVLVVKPNIRVLACGDLPANAMSGLDYKRVTGGLLVQDRDTADFDPHQLKVVTQRAPSDGEMADLLFVWRVAKFVKSNAIVYGKEGMTIGVGAGQMSRVYSARIAAIKAGDEKLEVKGCCMASDAFFPFRDSVDLAAEMGITAIIQPGGSIRDNEVILAANEHGIAMMFTGSRHFRH